MLFAEALRDGGDVIGDACRRIGIDATGMALPPRLASNISAPAQRFLRSFLPVAKQRLGADSDRVTGFVAERLRRTAPGQGELPPRDAVSRFMAQFAAGNERVRTEWFPERGRLFDIDLAAFPTKAETHPLESAEVFVLLADLLAAER